jgi:uracil-DNA glycosylase family 4
MAQPRYLKPPQCAGCALETIGWGFAPAVGPLTSRLLFIGEALGAEEAIAGEPFYGAAGGVLSRVMHRAGVVRNHVRIANIVSCRPPEDYLAGAPWEQHAIAMCSQYLQPVIDQLPENGVIVTLGATALQAVLRLAGVPGISVKDFHGTVNRSPDNRHWVVPTFHPSHLQRGAMNLLDVVTEDIKVADRVAREGFVKSPSTIVVDPPIEWYARWVTDHLAKVDADPDVVGLSGDTEFTGKGDDESEIVNAGRVNLTRFNFGNDQLLGGSVPYVGAYIRETDRLLSGIAKLGGWIWWWNKYADLVPLAAAGHAFADAQNLDLMWLAHHLHSDLPRGLGFWAPMASDYGPWKHLSKQQGKEGEYAAVDGLQNWRVGAWLIRAAHQMGMMEMFLRDWHERDRYVLRPAHELGVPINKPALVAYHEEMQRKLGVVLGRIKETAAKGVLKPKLGYAKRPAGKTCGSCGGTGAVETTGSTQGCEICKGVGTLDPTPPASILGKSKTGGGEAKLEYMSEGVSLVEREIEIEVTCCETCGAEAVGPKHRCPLPPRPKLRRKRDQHHTDSAAADAAGVGLVGEPAPVERARPVARLVQRAVRQSRWFWQLPFNPDAPAQILAYLAQQGIEAPIDKKKRKATTKKDALKKLAKDYADDPFFQLQLDWKAIQKVDATYAVGTLRRLDSDDRVHPEYLPKPSTLRDSCVDPNLTNVVADKAGPEGLASGFRRCIEARDGLPPGVTDQDFQQWRSRWT